jgi:hypothetical protein
MGAIPNVPSMEGALISGVLWVESSVSQCAHPKQGPRDVSLFHTMCHACCCLQSLTFSYFCLLKQRMHEHASDHCVHCVCCTLRSQTNHTAKMYLQGPISANAQSLQASTKNASVAGCDHCGGNQASTMFVHPKCLANAHFSRLGSSKLVMPTGWNSLP